MKKQINLLAKIQEKDRFLEQLRQEVAKGPEQIRRREQKVRTLADALEGERQRLDEVRKRQRYYEREIEEGMERIRKSKTRLLGIKNNKEYQAVLTEIEKTESSNADKEENILACMEETERMASLLKDKERELSQVKKEFGEEVEVIEKEMGQVRKKLAEEEEARQEIAKGIESGILAKYEYLKTLRGGVAVAQVENATCSGCHMNVPPQMYNELQRRDALRFCPNCERIVYWKRDDGESQEPGMSE